MLFVGWCAFGCCGWGGLVVLFGLRLVGFCISLLQLRVRGGLFVVWWWALVISVFCLGWLLVFVGVDLGWV